MLANAPALRLPLSICARLGRLAWEFGLARPEGEWAAGLNGPTRRGSILRPSDG